MNMYKERQLVSLACTVGAECPTIAVCGGAWELGSCSLNRAACLSSHNTALKAWRIPGLQPVQKAKKAGFW